MWQQGVQRREVDRAAVIAGSEACEVVGVVASVVQAEDDNYTDGISQKILSPYPPDRRAFSLVINRAELLPVIAGLDEYIRASSAVVQIGASIKG